MIWEAKRPQGYALHDSGAVVLGLIGPQIVCAFAPSEYELRVERATGRRIGYRELVGGVPPADLVALPTPPPTSFRIEAGLHETVAFWPDGRIAWRLVSRVPSSTTFPRSTPTGRSSVPPAPATSSCWIHQES